MSAATRQQIKERPIIFGAKSIKAILDGTKTQTRRVVKPQPPTVEAVRAISGTDYSYFTDRHMPDCFRVAGPVWAVRKLGGPEHLICRYGMPRERLWVREVFTYVGLCANGDPWTAEAKRRGRYREDKDGNPFLMCWKADGEEIGASWFSPIHMPRWASRINLEITGIRVERVQDISEADAKAEGLIVNHYYCDESGGAFGHRCKPAVDGFAEGWDSLNRKRGFGWEQNPFVWVIEFKRI